MAQAVRPVAPAADRPVTDTLSCRRLERILTAGGKNESIWRRTNPADPTRGARVVRGHRVARRAGRLRRPDTADTPGASDHGGGGRRSLALANPIGEAVDAGGGRSDAAGDQPAIANRSGVPDVR